MNNLIKKYIKEGYIVSPFNDVRCYDFEEKTKIKKIKIGKEKLKYFLTCSLNDLYDNLSSYDGYCLLKINDKYQITAKEISKKLENVLNSLDENSFDDLKAWLRFVCIDLKSAYYPNYDEHFYKKYLGDYLFKNDEHIVSYILFLMVNELNKDNFEENLIKYINFIKEIKSKEQEYSKETMSLILNLISYEVYMNENISGEMRQFYHDSLLENAEKGDNWSMKTLGYEYYEGTNLFPLDQLNSEYWLRKYFEATGDSDVARTLGYIYYYGRVNNGTPEKEKAFQYFAIGHFAGHYFEATYKLADCYVKGYGTPICHEAAYNLVTSIYAETLKIFLCDPFSKFADVALRLGQYYLDGIFVKKNLHESYLYFLEAKTALTTRLKAGDYIGDRGLAYKVNDSLNLVKEQLNIPQYREFKYGGYVTSIISERYDDCKIDLSFIDKNTLHIKLTKRKNDDQYFLNIKPNIAFGERSKTIEYYLQNFEFGDDCYDSFDCLKITSITIDNEHLIIFKGKEISGGKIIIHGMFENVIVVPQSLQNPNKLYNIIKVNIDGRMYQYLSDKDVLENEDVNVLFNNELINTKVVEVNKVYEDELPLPLEKMNKTIDDYN